MGKNMFDKSNRVLFIIHDVYQDDNEFPLGPAYMAAVLHEKGAYVEAYCMDVFHYTNQQLADHLENNEYDIIGLGFLAARFKETVVELCKVVNKHKKDAWFVLGGQGPSPIPEYILRDTKADIVAIGEAEETIIDLLSCKIKKTYLSSVKSIAYLKNDKLVITPIREPIRNLDSIPFPLWRIFPMDKYTTSIQTYNQKEGEKSFTPLTSRGCVNRCNFCYRMEKGIRVRSIENVLAELKCLHDTYRVTCYNFQDELFVLNKERLRQFEAGLKSINLKIKYACNARVDIFDEEMVELLKRTGCQFINFGFESSSNDVLKLMNKNTNAELNINALEIVKKAGGIAMGLNFIWNNLGDNAETLQRNVDLIKKYNTYEQLRTIRPVTPYPGCDLYYKLIQMGKLKGPEDFFNKFKNSDLILVNIMDMSDKEAYDALLKANTELIIDFYNKTKGDMNEAKKRIKAFSDLYSGKILNFRGVRHVS